MQEIEQLTASLRSGADLSGEHASAAARALAAAEVGEAAKKDFLLALSAKGERAGEVAAFAETFRKLAVDPGVDAFAERAIDVCGTGGDGSGTFNISTAVSFILAASGVPVFKHGNRSITSKCGSADLMDALGIRLEAPHALIRRSLEELNFCFFFAPAYHPAFKEIMPVRRALAREGKRTVFNLLGPLINPGRPAYQLLGVFSDAWVEPLAAALGQLKLKGGVVAYGRIADGGSRGLDELSCAGDNLIAGFGRFESKRGAIDCGVAGLERCPIGDLRGGDVKENVALMELLLQGGGRTVPAGLRDSILFNAGVALWIAGQADSMREGVDRARDTLESREAWGWLVRARQFYADSLASS